MSAVAFRPLPLIACCLGIASLLAAEPEPKSPDGKAIEVAGKAEFLRGVPKRYAALKAIDPVRRSVTLLIEGETLAKVWPLAPDAEVKVAGWWGRLDQFTVGDRVWVWFQADRQKQAVAVAMLADEHSEQDMHGRGVTLVAQNADGITIKPTKGDDRTLKTNRPCDLPLDKPVFVQSSGDTARLVLDAAAFEARRKDQKAALRKRWADEGLPGTATFLHRFSGEMEVMLDHEAMRWARSLQAGDEVRLDADPPIAGVVKQVRPWRERTEVRLIVGGFDQADISVGQRVRLKMKPPPAEVDEAQLPPDVDRPRASREERIEWFLASIYCTCGVHGDTCTGHFYTLASCNPNACGAPNQARQEIGELIDKRLTDRQIFERLLKDRGRTSCGRTWRREGEASGVLARLAFRRPVWDEPLLEGLGGLQQLGGRGTVLVTLLEQLRPHDAVHIDHEHAGVGNPLRLPLGFLVKDAVSLDGLAAGVVEERELDVLLVGEGREGLNVVVADGHDL